MHLSTYLDNAAPVFTSATPSKLHVKVGKSVTIKVEANDSDVDSITISASVSRGMVTAKTSGTVQSSSAATYREFTWTPQDGQKVPMEFKATDSKGSVNVMSPQIVLCNCKNGGSCDFSIPQVFVASSFDKSNSK